VLILSSLDRDAGGDWRRCSASASGQSASAVCSIGPLAAGAIATLSLPVRTEIGKPHRSGGTLAVRTGEVRYARKQITLTYR
jgi:hypothetical protein